MDAPANPRLSFDPSTLPVAQLESLRFKATQIIESINVLARTIEANGFPYMPSWPEVLSKYNVLLSQTHSFSSALERSAGGLSFESIALHPSTLPTEGDMEKIEQVLRTFQAPAVLDAENACVARLSEHMKTRGSLGLRDSALSSNLAAPPTIPTKKVDISDILAELQAIKEAHDARVERGVRAVQLLRDKYDWKARVTVDEEDPEDLQWDPRQDAKDGADVVDGDVEMDTPDDTASDDEEDAVEEELGDAETPVADREESVLL